jgi:hypothetical protein
MTKISNKSVYKKKIPLVSDTVFGGDNENNGDIVRYDMEALAQLMKEINEGTPSTVKVNSYFPSGW